MLATVSYTYLNVLGILSSSMLAAAGIISYLMASLDETQGHAYQVREGCFQGKDRMH